MTTMVLPLLPLLLLASGMAPAGLDDKGVFSQLDPQVSVAVPAWAARTQTALALDRKQGMVTLLFDGEPVAAFPIHPSCADDRLDCLGLRESDRDALKGVFAPAPPATAFVAPAFSDSDGDGIADSVDILLGAKKTVLLHSEYRETAPKLAYPGGDVPPEVGVCTDVIVRALRNAGFDLQKLVFEDAGRAPKAYPGIRGRNTHLDHRRVRNLAVYFQRHWRPIHRIEDLLPGDVILLDTFPNKPGPDHIGIVSDTLGRSRLPLIINAWTNGYRTEEMDLLPSIPMTIAYRAPASRPGKSADVQGLVLPSGARQMVLVVTEDWQSPTGSLSTWEKGEKGWRRRSSPKPVSVGATGLGWGRGLHPENAGTLLGGPHKQEGDNRAPAGLFRLSSATGYAASAPAGSKLPYQQAGERLRCVDDPSSPDYNQLRRLVPGRSPGWTSDEAMKRGDDQYRLTIVVEHNRAPAKPGAGSCIFLHAWPAPGIPSPGCTMMAFSDVKDLVTWLDPRAEPVLVQLPKAIVEKVAAAWGLPGENW
jgi:uncharacterized protein YijF (DUF1287 family)